MAIEPIAVEATASDLCRGIAQAWRMRSVDPRLHVPWERVRDGEYVGTVGGRRVTLLFRRHYETVDAAGNARLRNPARTRCGLTVACECVEGGWARIQSLADVGVRGESSAAMDRFDSRRRGLDERARRVFGLTPEWGSI